MPPTGTKSEDSVGPNIKLLEARVRAYFSRLQAIYDTSLGIESPEIQEKFMSRSANVLTLRSEFHSLIEQLHVARMDADDEYIPSYKTWDAFEEMYSHIQHAIAKLTVSQSAGAASGSGPPSSAKPNLKLPPIVLQTFDGDHKKFASFLDCYNSTVHNNNSLSKSEKVFYLCGQLSGKALASIAGIVPCGENYKLIYDTLVDKYEDVRLLGTSYLDELFDFENLDSPSAKGLIEFIDCFVTSVAAFDKLKIADKKEFIFLYLALKKIDSETARIYENSVRSEKLPNYDGFVKFIKEQAKILERRGDPTPPAPCQYSGPHLSTPQTGSMSKRTQAFVSATPMEIPPCNLCNSRHDHLYQCTEFRSLDPRERYNIVKRNGCCVRCLSAKHKSAVCRSNHCCQSCNSHTHHSLLHFAEKAQNTSALAVTLSSGTKYELGNAHANNNHMDTRETRSCPVPAPAPRTRQSSALNVPPVSSISNEADASHVSHNYLQANISRGGSTVLLPTAKVNVLDKYGNLHVLRCLVDSGSQNHFITAACCAKLSLEIEKEELPTTVNGFGGAFNPTKGKTMLTIGSRHDKNIFYDLQSLVVDNVTAYLPTAPVDYTALTYLSGLPLADDSFHNPGAIDLVIGAGLFGSLLMPGRVRGPLGSPEALQSTLGFLLIGTASIAASCAVSKPVALCAFTGAPPIKIVERFREIEEVPSSTFTYLSADKQECDEYYRKATRNETGKHSRALSFKGNPEKLGYSLPNVQKRFSALERKFIGSSVFQSAYNPVVADNEDKAVFNRCNRRCKLVRKMNGTYK